ncbi:hypothetical protein NFJ07_02265 [Arthrobacter sp. B2a2-09]|nr:hypothetical protein [Arthrobacter sp. B2a2-09]
MDLHLAGGDLENGRRAQSAVVGVHAPLAGAALTNTSRGAILREPELVDALGQRPDLVAILDVTWPEPPERDSPLFHLPYVLHTGHAAGAGGTECFALGDLVADEVARFVRGLPLQHAVTQRQSRVRA